MLYLCIVMRRVIYYLPTLCVMVGITYVSLWREPTFSLPRFVGADKVAHVVMYAVLSVVFVWDRYRAQQGKIIGWKRAAVLVVFALYGGLIELLQEYFFYPRTGTWGDWLADCGGCVVGLIVYVLFVLRSTVSQKRNTY